MHDTSKVMTNVLEKFTILLLSLKNVHLKERERERRLSYTLEQTISDGSASAYRDFLKLSLVN